MVKLSTPVWGKEFICFSVFIMVMRSIRFSTFGVAKLDFLVSERIQLSDPRFPKAPILAVPSSFKRATVRPGSAAAEPSVPASRDISTSLCHKTLFGEVEFNRVIEWVVYHHLLGIDHIYIWYSPDEPYDLKDTGFKRLAKIPYVTLLMSPRPNKHLSYNPDHQIALERWCLQEKAAHFDWVFLADADEYLWLNQTQILARTSQVAAPKPARAPLLKEFLHLNRHFDYLSFGKHMYSTADVDKERIEEDGSSFAVERFPFTTGPFCHVSPFRSNLVVNEFVYRGSPVCPGFAGRAKVMVRPQRHSHVEVHGKYRDATRMPPHARHFPTSDAHLKEWQGLYTKSGNNFSKRARLPQDFTFVYRPGLQIHQLRSSHATNTDGTYNMYHDGALHDWMKTIERG